MTVKLLIVVFSILLTISCKGQEPEKVTNEIHKESNHPETKDYQPLVFNPTEIDPKHHATLNGTISEFVWNKPRCCPYL